MLGNCKTLIIGKKIQLGITEQVAGTSPKIVSDVVCAGRLSLQETVESFVANGSEKGC